MLDTLVNNCKNVFIALKNQFTAFVFTDGAVSDNFRCLVFYACVGLSLVLITMFINSFFRRSF